VDLFLFYFIFVLSVRVVDCVRVVDWFRFYVPPVFISS